MNPEEIDVVELLPHGPEMTLIDKLIESSPARSVAVVEIVPESEFVGEGGVPAWIGIEYMAQTIAARIGFEARLNGQPPRIGYLLGTRRFVSKQPRFSVGSRLLVVAEPLLVDAGFGSFSCSIEIEHVIATAVLNTYQPDGEAQTAANRR